MLRPRHLGELFSGTHPVPILDSSLMEAVMAQERQFVSKRVTCPDGHQIKLEILSGTPDTKGVVECPVCGIAMTVLSGDIRGVVPIRPVFNSGHESRLIC